MERLYRTLRRLLFGVLAFISLPQAADAYALHSILTDGCHERLASEALRQVRHGLALAGAAGAGRDDGALLDDLPFPIDAELRDIGAAALILGNRDNDLKGTGFRDWLHLAAVQGAALGQREHCLRRAEDDEPGGSEKALGDCRAYFLETARHALLAGLDADGAPDLARRTILDVYLPLAGASRVELPIFYVYLGQAMHTLQDSFAHTLRTPDHRRVTVLLNWVDYATNEFEAQRDGPAHMTAMDQCSGIADLRQARFGAAQQASVDLLRAALAPGSLDDRLAAVQGVADAWMSYQPGCNYDTRWCDAPEMIYADGPAASCHSSSSADLYVVIGALFAARRRARPRRSR